MAWLWLVVPFLFVLWLGWTIRGRAGAGPGFDRDLAGERDRRTGGFHGNNG